MVALDQQQRGARDEHTAVDIAQPNAAVDRRDPQVALMILDRDLGRGGHAQPQIAARLVNNQRRVAPG